jgi:hypothetical protein
VAAPRTPRSWTWTLMMTQHSARAARASLRVLPAVTMICSVREAAAAAAAICHYAVLRRQPQQGQQQQLRLPDAQRSIPSCRHSSCRRVVLCAEAPEAVNHEQHLQMKHAQHGRACCSVVRSHLLRELFTWLH